MSQMSQTRIVFIVIIGIAVCLAGGVFVFSAIRGIATSIATNSNTSISTNSNDSGNSATAVPAGSVLVTLDSSNTKEDWIDAVVTQFNAANQQTASGKTIVVQVTHGTSGGTMNNIINGKSQPVAWSPGDQSWVGQLNDTWKQKVNKPIASQACPATINAPLGFAMWKPMAETLGWPTKPIGWDTIVALAEDPNGWATYGRPEWGKFRFGHTHPAYANSGLLSLTSFVYGIAGKTDGLTTADVYSDEVQQALRGLEQVTSKYGRQAPDLLDLMARQGPSYLHAAAVPEAEVVRFNVTRGDELTFPLAFIFPSAGTMWADQPYCILDNADWVTDEQAEAAKVFLNYLLAKPQQELAIDNYLRPLDSKIPLHAPMDLAHGTDPSVSRDNIPYLPSPSADISNAVIDIFQINKRKATILVVIDTSGSMEGERINTARTSTNEFLSRLNADDEVGLIVFSDNVNTLAEPSRVGDVVEGLKTRVGGLLADGNTAIYEAVCTAVSTMKTLQEEDTAKGESRLYGIILLSDGEDTVGRTTENQMFATCLPANAEADGIKIYPIAFGDAADQSVLQRIANVTGGRLFTADPDSISNVYTSISAEQ